MSYFISGIPSSGTTLLVNLLGYHSELEPIYETWFVVQWAKILAVKPEGWQEKIWKLMDEWSEPLPHRPSSKKEYESYPFGDHHILFNRDQAKLYTSELLEKVDSGVDPWEAMQKAIESLYEAHMNESDASEWINKTPMYLAVLPMLKKTFPDMKLINCVRDGRDVAWSVKEKPAGPDDPEEIPEWWTKLAIAGRSFEQNFPDQYLEVKYEDMINDTEETVKKCLNFLDLEDESEQIVEDYPVEIYSKRIGVYEDKPPLNGFKGGKPRKILEKLGYV